jgi:hypothetical protein
MFVNRYNRSDLIAVFIPETLLDTHRREHNIKIDLREIEWEDMMLIAATGRKFHNILCCMCHVTPKLGEIVMKTETMQSVIR